MVLHLLDSWLNWNLEMLVFEERRKLDYLEKNLLEQGREPTTNLTHIWHQTWELNPAGHIGGRGVLSPLHHHALLPSCMIIQFLKCKIPDRVLLSEAICKRFSKVLHQWRCVACHPLQFTLILQTIFFPGRGKQNLPKEMRWEISSASPQ